MLSARPRAAQSRHKSLSDQVKEQRAKHKQQNLDKIIHKLERTTEKKFVNEATQSKVASKAEEKLELAQIAIEERDSDRYYEGNFEGPRISKETARQKEQEALSKRGKWGEVYQKHLNRLVPVEKNETLDQMQKEISHWQSKVNEINVAGAVDRLQQRMKKYGDELVESDIPSSDPRWKQYQNFRQQLHARKKQLDTLDSHLEGKFNLTPRPIVHRFEDDSFNLELEDEDNSMPFAPKSKRVKIDDEVEFDEEGQVNMFD